MRDASGLELEAAGDVAWCCAGWGTGMDGPSYWTWNLTEPPPQVQSHTTKVRTRGPRIRAASGAAFAWLFSFPLDGQLCLPSSTLATNADEVSSAC